VSRTYVFRKRIQDNQNKDDDDDTDIADTTAGYVHSSTCRIDLEDQLRIFYRNNKTASVLFNGRQSYRFILYVDQVCFIFPCIFDFQLRDRRLVDRPSTEPTLCQSDWLTVTSICGVVLMGMRRKQQTSS